MTLGHRNRIRRDVRNSQACELEIAEAFEPAEISPVLAEFEGHAYETHGDPSGAPGDVVADRLQAEDELHAGEPLSALPPNRRSCSGSYSLSNVGGNA